MSEENINLLNQVLDSQNDPESDPLTSSQTRPDDTTEQVVAFRDEDAGWTTEIAQSYESTMDLGRAADAELGDFLSRPVKAQSVLWNVGELEYYKFNPWQAFLENPRVQEKIANYELLRCNMHMKMLVSGTPFHYGRALVSYNPFSLDDEVSVQREPWVDADLVAGSQRPHFYINPTANTGGEMTLPYFFNNNFLSLSRQDYTQMGDVTIKSFNSLRHANFGTDPVTITIYVWASDVVLTMPTDYTSVATLRSAPMPTILESQAMSKSAPTRKAKKGPLNRGNDEYGGGIVSKPASAVAKAAGTLASVPFIGPYARATEIVASGVGAVARLFGFSRPNIITDIVQMKPSPTGNLANADAGDAALKLTLDSKCELSIDPRITGITAQDEMDLKSIAMKESYLTQFAWPAGLTPDTVLFQSRVAPNLVRVEGDELHPTPMGMLSQYFNKWQGTIKFRFQVVKSKYHKGRLLIRYDPTAHTGAPGYNNQYTRVIDIAEEEDFEIEIGWGQARPWLNSQQFSKNLENEQFQSYPVPAGDIYDFNAAYNGVLEIAVVNDLTSPGDDLPINVNVFVSAGEDMKWAAPDPDKFRNLHLWPEPPVVLESQSTPETMGSGESGMPSVASAGIDEPGVAAKIQQIGSLAPEADHTYDVFYGECVTNLRQMFKRYVFTRTYIPPRSSDNTSLRVTYNRIKDIPYYSGYDPAGINTDSNSVPCTVGQTTPLNWFAPCYAAMRGGHRRKYLFSASGEASSNPVVSRMNSAPPGYVNSEIDTNTATDDEVSKFLSYRFAQFSNAGSAATNIGINNTIEVELPAYSSKRFLPARAISASSLPTNSHAVHTTDLRRPGEPIQSLNYQEWTCAAEDFSLYFWTGAPVLYNYALTETS